MHISLYFIVFSECTYFIPPCRTCLACVYPPYPRVVTIAPQFIHVVAKITNLFLQCRCFAIALLRSSLVLQSYRDGGVYHG